MIGKENKKNEKEKKNKIESIIDMDISKELRATSHKYHGDEDILINSGLNTNNIKRDLLIFKDEILKDLKRQQAKIFEKSEFNGNYITQRIEEFENRIEKFNERIISLSNMIITDKTIREKVESLIEYKTKNQELVMTNGIKINNLDKDLFENIYRIDSILKETVMYPGVIGGISKFKTFHDFMDYVLSECSQNITFREKTAIDINNLRNNNERIINNFTNKLEKAKKTLTLYVDTCIKRVENKINSLNDLFNERLTNYRIENMTYSENMKKASESLLKQVNSVIQAKNDIFNKFDEKMNIINKENSRMIKYFTGYKNEFNEMRRIFKEMIEALNKKDFNGMNRKINRLSRRQTSFNNDFKVFENNLNKLNNVIHPISMNDMFMSENKFNNRKISLMSNNLTKEKEKSNPYQLFLKEYKRIDTENKRISRFFEKENTFIEKKKNADLKLTQRTKKRHHKKIKLLNEIYISYLNPTNIEFIKRKLSKNNSVCVPNKKFNIQLLKKVKFESKENLEKSKTIVEFSKSQSNINKINKVTTRNKDIIFDNIINTSISKSENSLFSNDSKISEKEEVIKKNNIKKKYKTNIVIKEKKEINSSNTINEKDSIEQNKLELNKKEYLEDKDLISIDSKIQNDILLENKKQNIKLEKRKIEKKKGKSENDIKINEKNIEKNNPLKKIYITIEGSNQLEIDPYSKQNNKNQKNLVNNVKTILNNKMGKTLSGYPKIVTNNGERIIYSSHPIYKKQKFNSYKNPNLLALTYSVNTLFEENDDNKPYKTRQNIYETNPDYIFQNKKLLLKMKNSYNNNTERTKKVSFNIFKSMNAVNNNLHFSKKKSNEENKFG